MMRYCNRLHAIKKRALFIPALIGAVLLAVSCGAMYSELAENLSKGIPGSEITSFSFPSVGAIGIISGTGIAVTVPFGTDVTGLVAAFTTTGKSVEVGLLAQSSGVTVNDFTGPVTYTVTATDGFTRNYTVIVSVAPSTAKDITDFVILGVHGAITSNAIALTVPYGTDVTNLTPTVTITGASISPASGVPRNFSSPVTYTVTAADGSTQNYTVTVSVALNPAKDITDFVILGVHGTITGTAIALTVPYGTDVTNLTPTVTITGASVSPASGVPRNFSSPVTYTVTAADGSTQNYTVTVTIALNPAKDITDFVILGFHGTITGTAIALTVPYGTDVTNLTPTITITGASVSPASGVPGDFSSPVTYTVTAADSSTKNYTVTVTANGTLAGSSFTTGSSPYAVTVDPVANILYVVNYGSNSVTFFNATTGAYLWGDLASSSFPAGSGPYGIALNTSVNTIYITNSGSSTVTYLDATTGALKGTYPTGLYPKGVSVDPAANILYVANQNSNNVTYLNATTGALIGTYPAGTTLSGCEVNPGINRVYVTGTLTNTVLFLSATSGAIMGTYSTLSGPVGVAVNPVANILYVTCYMSNGVQFFDATTGSNLGFHSTGAGPRMGIAVDPAANILYVVNMDSNTVRYLNATTGGTLGTYTTGTNPSGVAVNTNMNIIYVTNRSSNTVTFLDATTGEYIY